MNKVFTALGNPTRRQILRILQRRGECAAGDLADQVDVSKPTLSHHLAALHDAGLVDRERRGSHVLYRVNQSVVEELVQAVMDLLGVEDTAPVPSSSKESS